MRKYLIPAGAILLITIITTSTVATSDPILAISVGDTFNYDVQFINNVKINGTDFSDPESQTEDSIEVEVLEISNDNSTVTVKETYSDDTTEIAKSTVDTWQTYFLFGFVFLYVGFVTQNPELFMNFEEPTYANTTSSGSDEKDVTFQYFVNSDPNTYEDLDDAETDADITVDAAAATYSYEFTNVTKAEGALTDGTLWSVDFDFSMKFFIEYGRSLVTEIRIEYFMDEKLGDSTKSQHLLISIKEGDASGLAGIFSDLPAPQFYLGLLSLIAMAVIFKRRKY